MSVLEKLASSLSRNDEVLNQQLAAEIALNGDSAATFELVAGVTGKSQPIASDCIKVLYEIGERRPELITPHVDVFLDLLSHKHNRIVWGAMTALGQIAAQTSDRIAARLDEVIGATDVGSVISQDWGIRVLAQVGARQPTTRDRLIPYFEHFLNTTIPRDVPKHAESMLPAITSTDRGWFQAALKRREPELSPAQATRLRKILRRIPA